MSTLLTNVPVPGQSLTRSPDTKLPVEQPPQSTEINDAIGKLLDDLTSKEKLPAITKVLRSEKVYIDRLTSAYIEKAMVDGRFNADLGHLMIEPVMFTFMWIASQIGAPVKFRELKHYSSSGMDVLEGRINKEADMAVDSLLSPAEEEV